MRENFFEFSESLFVEISTYLSVSVMPCRWVEKTEIFGSAQILRNFVAALGTIPTKMATFTRKQIGRNGLTLRGGKEKEKMMMMMEKCEEKYWWMGVTSRNLFFDFTFLVIVK